MFNNYEKFLREDCDSVEDGWGYRVGGLRDADSFAAKTKNLIIRRTKDEVLKDLPKKQRNFHHVELDPKVNKAYAAALKELDELFYSDDNSFDANSNRLAILNRMRHITGISKIDDYIEFVTDFLFSTNRKIVLFTHHTDVAEILKKQLNIWLAEGDFSPVLHFTSGLDDMAAAKMQTDFRDTNARIMIASTLAAGEGLNLQFCSDAVMLERQWNPPNEVQAEDRFHRFGQENPVTITYMIASGTIDEYFTEIVERKRAIISATMDNKQVEWEQSSLMKELTELLVTRDRKRWSF
jgi:SWI/SNF-related matrix-associated actin-dependent regulator 1 of chromatin subfamily A